MTELTDPVGVVLDVGNVIDRLRTQAAAGVELVALGEREVALGAVDVDRLAGLKIQNVCGVV